MNEIDCKSECVDGDDGRNINERAYRISSPRTQNDHASVFVLKSVAWLYFDIIFISCLFEVIWRIIIVMGKQDRTDWLILSRGILFMFMRGDVNNQTMLLILI